jgi:16S rRNA (guanine527-N7)-methyltransferase
MNSDLALIEKYFPNLTVLQKEQFTQLKPLYEEWNAQINVISRKDVDSLYERHILHSLSIAKFISFKKGTKLMDLGCGGGFPGIPLAILFPEVSFSMIDSIGKKIKVVQEIYTAIGLQNVQAYHMRAEKVEDTFDFVITRAVAPMVDLVKWTRKKYSKINKHEIDNGVIALKGGDLSSELATWGKRKTVVSLSEYFEEDFFETKQIIHIPVKNKNK